jgi:histidinol-phosphate phosphatase family protein
MDFTIDKSWTLFLDRDGVINERIFGGYVSKPEEFNFLDSVPQAIKEFRTLFAHVIVVTNQQCIAKNVVTRRNLRAIHTYMQNALMENDTYVDAVYFAPELAGDPANTRKPKPALALEAKIDFPSIDFSRSIMVGDTDSDIAFGKNLGMKTARVVTEEPIGIEADFNVKSLQELAIKLKDSNV